MSNVDPREVFAEGVEAHRQSDYERAEELFQRVLAQVPDHAPSLINLAVLAQERGRMLDAIAWAERAVAAQPLDTAPHAALGSLLKLASRTADAVGPLRRALATDSANQEARINLALVLCELERKEEALEVASEAIQLTPESAEARYAWAQAYTFRTRDPEVGRLRDMAARDGLSRMDRVLLGFALGKANDDARRFDDAFAAYSAANRIMAEDRPFDVAAFHDRLAAIKAAIPMASRGRRNGNAAKPIPIFVTGVSRSGKTIAEALLARGAGIAPLGERLEWIEAVNSVVSGRGIDAGYPDCVAALDESDIAAIGETYRAMMAAAAPGAEYAVNTLPSAGLYLGLVFQALPDALVVNCRRDFRDVCIASYFKLYGTGNHYSYDLGWLGEYHKGYSDLMAHWKGLSGQRMFDLLYEEAVTRPEAVAQRLAAFCGTELAAPLPEDTFRTDDIGRWRGYEEHLARAGVPRGL